MDEEKEREVSYEEGMSLANNVNSTFLEISSVKQNKTNFYFLKIISIIFFLL